MTAMTRGPLPARVYWRRRLLVLLLAAGLVVGTARLLSLGSDGSSEPDAKGAQVAAEATASQSTGAATERARPQEREGSRPGRDRQPRGRDRRPVLAEPEGICADRDVAATPSVRTPVAGSPVTFTVELRTIASPACTWRVSPATLTMKLTSGSDEIWTSRECPRAIPRRDVVVRNNVGTEVEVTWSGRRSDAGCSALTEWALPGWYYVDVAALAGEPSDLHFELVAPEPGVVKETIRPRPREARGRDRDRKDEADRRGGGRGRTG